MINEPGPSMRPTPLSVLLLVTSLAAAVIVLAARNEVRPPLPANSVDEAQPPLLADPRAHPTTFYGVPALEWDLRYRVGMSRDQIHPNLPRDVQRFASVSRPSEGWKALKHKESSSVVPLVTEFEAKHPGALVWACDFFEADGYQFHLLFYDAGGVLIGFERWGGYAVLSAALGPANPAHPLFATISLSWHIGRPLAIRH